ncbi:unnamed protein product, partial [Ectocarpus fasciculatus]
MASINTLARVATATVGRAPATSRRIATAATAPARRFLSTTSEAAAAKPEPAAAEETSSSGGSSFLQRVAAFLTGAGVGCGVGYYHLAGVRRNRPTCRL